jgi:hypothetical protein
MDTTLVTVTLLSMGMAAALSVIVWRMLRDERLRSEARVLALAQRSTPALAGASRPAPRDLRQGTRAGGPIRVEEHGTELEGRETRDLMLRATPAPAAAMFAERAAASPWGNRLAVMAGLALVLASGILLALTARDRTGAEARPAAATGAAAQSGASTAPAIGLELLSLRDARQSAALTITGLVQNPRGGAALSGVTVTAYAFDEKGSFLASGRAPIDVSALAPGDESPFVVSVSVPVTDAVARYRIGFRGGDGRVIAHIDKRQQAPVAVNW